MSLSGAPIGPGCYTCGPARETSISGIYNPWQNDLVEALQAAPFGTPSTNLSDASEFQGYQAFAMDPLAHAYRMQLDIRPLGTVLFSTGESAPDAGQIAGGIRYCPANMRIKWIERGGKIQYVDVGVGAGISFGVPPTNQVSAFWLIPNPRTNSDVLVPANFDRNATRFATTATALGTVVYSPSPVRPTLSQMLFVTTSQGAAGHQVFLPRGARSLQIFASPAFGNLPAPAIGQIIAEFVQEYTVTPVGTSPPAPEDTFPREEISFTTTVSTERVTVPPGFSAVRIHADPGTPDIARNVTLVWELDI